jgi:hypothetical protein
VAATLSAMDEAARAHLKHYHANDSGLARTKDITRFCQWTNCRCTKAGCAEQPEPHAVHSKTVRTRVVRTHFVDECRRKQAPSRS